MTRGVASPPCLAAEIDPAYFDPLAVDAEQARDVARWRKAERLRLLSERASLTVSARQMAAKTVASHLDAVLAARFGNLEGLTISAWWPIKSELDLRFWLGGLARRGAFAALPRVAQEAAPLTFRHWTPGMRTIREVWNIPVPAQGPNIVPDVILAPLVGWDAAGYRLGYGGGYFDRTLATTHPAPYSIGIGLQAARLPTIYPQPHDIPMQRIITEKGIMIPEPA
jgi:5,10-methenyltetrahydrofolate synthetase